MRNREAILRKVDQIDSTINKITFYISRGDKESYENSVETLREQLSQLKTYIESEPIVGSELNPN